MLKISICDDNPQFSDVLAEALRQLCAFHLPERIECTVGPVFHSAKEVLSYLEAQSIDILFLDIDMPKINGFDAAECINRKHPSTLIIFVSAHDDLVFSSFEYRPLCFLRKSHLREELPRALRRAVDQCVSDMESVTLKSIDGTVVLRIKDVLYAESDKNYYTVYCASGDRHRCRGTLNTLAELLQGYDFFRAHASYLISLAHVESVKGRRDVEMKNHVHIPLTKDRAEEFHRRYTAYIRRNLFR